MGTHTLCRTAIYTALLFLVALGSSRAHEGSNRETQGVFEFDLSSPWSQMSELDSYLAGAFITRQWAEIEPEENVYNWASLDASIRHVAQRGKKAAIRVSTYAGARWYPPDRQSNTPHWVYALGAAKFGAGSAYMLVRGRPVLHDQANGNRIPDIKQVPYSADGRTLATRIRNWPALQTYLEVGSRYMYFDLDNEMFYGQPTPCTVTISYYDVGYDTMDLEYPAAGPASLVILGGLNSDSDGNGVPDGWWFWSHPDNESTVTLDTEIKYQAEASARLTCVQGIQMTALIQIGSNLALGEGRTYEFGAYLRADRNHRVQVQMVDPETNEVLVYRDFHVGKEFSDYSFTFTSPVTIPRPKLVIAFFGVGQVWVDGVTLTPILDSPTYQSAGPIRRTNTRLWKIAQWHLPEAVFANQQAGGTADFRLVSGEELNIHVRYIDVHIDGTDVGPVYFDPIYQAKYADFIRDLGRTYADNPRIAYVMCSFGENGEIYVWADGPLERLGYTHDRYIAYVKRIADEYRAAFPNTRLTAGLGGLHDSNGWSGRGMTEIPSYLARRGIQLEYCGGMGDPADGYWYDWQGESTPGTLSYAYIKYRDDVPVGTEQRQDVQSSYDVRRWLWHLLSLHVDSIRIYTDVHEAHPWAAEFASQFTGKHVEETPAVWVALREGLTRDYTFWLYHDDAPSDGHTWVTDGYDPATWIGGRECRATQNNLDSRYMYFKVDDGFILDGTNPVQFTVYYYDKGVGKFTIEYDGVGNPYTSTPAVQLTDSREWRSAQIVVQDATFLNRQTDGCDFRIDSRGEDVYINWVEVRKVN